MYSIEILQEYFLVHNPRFCIDHFCFINIQESDLLHVHGKILVY